MKDRTAIVTGGTGALGRKIVIKLADEGVKVYVPARNLDDFNSVFDNSGDENASDFKLRRIYSFVCNASDENSVKEFVKNVYVQEKGRIDFLVNTVGGIGPVSFVADIESSELDRMIDLNLKSAFYFSREALKIMKINKYGRIISIGAMAALDTSPGRFAYSFAKAGVINLMNTISEESKGENIRCNTIVPSVIDTPANREWGSDEEMKKWVKPEEIANIVYSLISDKFSSVRNSVIKVYGAL